MNVEPAVLNFLLAKLCADFGFCLGAEERVRLQSYPLNMPDDFADEVFRAEGLNPTTVDRHLYQQVRNTVRIAFQHGGTR